MRLTEQDGKILVLPTTWEKEKRTCLPVA
jgi:hypothetical protein